MESLIGTGEIWWEEGKIPFLCPYWTEFFRVRRKLTKGELKKLRMDAVLDWEARNPEFMAKMVQEWINADDRTNTELDSYRHFRWKTFSELPSDEEIHLQHFIAGMTEGTALDVCGASPHTEGGAKGDFVTLKGRSGYYIE